MELKRSNKDRVTPLQKHTLLSIAGACGKAWEINPENWDQAWSDLLQLSGGLK